VTATGAQGTAARLNAALAIQPATTTTGLARRAQIGRSTAYDLLQQWEQAKLIRRVQPLTGHPVWERVPQPGTQFTRLDAHVALGQLQAELTANAPAIAAILDAVEEINR
jgi:Fe2+ or Zn2+ uptake regulation protein